MRQFMLYGNIGQLEGSWGVVGLPQTSLAQLLPLPGQLKVLYVRLKIKHVCSRWTSQTGTIYIPESRLHFSCLLRAFAQHDTLELAC